MPKAKKAPWRPNRISKDVVAILYVALRQVLILDRKNPTSDNPDMRQIVLVINPSARGIDLSNYTEEELDLFKKIIDQACELARPLCQELDRETEEAMKINDIRYRRLWRATPRYINFPKEDSSDIITPTAEIPGPPDGEGDEREHGQGLPSRP